jgi:hypothetical protein
MVAGEVERSAIRMHGQQLRPGRRLFPGEISRHAYGPFCAGSGFWNFPFV